ncbi:MAG: ferritin family protein [Kiritimatiellia bacterium]|jgi:rubrerythrin|nr:ferritin family protein [Kiritimatiellia bacterium]MDP6847179.1 ferritin family protein [Kiritimatiellia bacterium]
MTDVDNSGRWNSVGEMLDFAVQREQDAVDFYTTLKEMSTNPGIVSALDGYIREEDGHKMKLSKLKADGHLEPASSKVLNLRISDYLVDIEPSPDMSYQELLIIAMKREDAACKLYEDLAAATEQEDLRDALLALAQEEAKHKLRFETEYDDHVLMEQ